MGQHQKLAVVVVAVAVLFAGCAGLGGSGGNGDAATLASGDGGDGASGDGADAGAPGTPAPEADGARASGDGGGSDGGTSSGQSSQSSGDIRQLASDRAIIRTGSVTVRVDDFETHRARLEAEVNRLGGYVGSSTVQLHQRHNETWRTGTVTLRVPSESFSRMLSDAKDRGEVLAEQTSTKDVTDQLVELDARITNLAEKRSRLRAFYEQAEDTQALLRIEDRLSEVQGQIEQLKAKKRSLADRVAFSTLTVNLEEPAPEAESAKPTTQRAGLVGALQGSVDGLLDLGYSALLVAAAALPWLLALAGLGIALYAARRLFAVPAVRAVVPGRGGRPAGPGVERRPRDEAGEATRPPDSGDESAPSPESGSDAGRSPDSGSDAGRSPDSGSDAGRSPDSGGESPRQPDGDENES